MSKTKRLLSFTVVIVVICSFFSAFSISTSAAVPTAVTPTSPANGQIVPYFEVWVQWNDVSDENYYLVSIRDISISETSDESLIYNQAYVAANSTHFSIPYYKLTRGHQYRWVVLSVNSSGMTCSATRHFTIESGTGTDDVHIRSGGFASTQRLEYFVYATASGYDDVLDYAAQSWNGVSSNVNLVRTGTPVDNKYEIGIFQSPSPTGSNPVLFGKAFLYESETNKSYIVSNSGTWGYAQIETYYDNIAYAMNYYSHQFLTSNFNIFSYANAMHELGHALSLNHTGDVEDNLLPISRSTLSPYELIPLIMNSGTEIALSTNFVDRDHLRMKWGY